MARNFHQGKFNIKNPKKYIGDVTDCIYRSGWERTLMAKLDVHSKVIKWGSEPFHIPYLSPVDARMHRYFPDFIVVVDIGNGQTVTTLIEVKPFKETLPPERKQGKKASRYLYECKTYAVNTAKWRAAETVCKKKGWQWRIIGEKELVAKF